jgi:glutamate synthase (NADPH/NADH)
MGISTLQGYKGAQIFEALGIHQTVVEACFTGCATRIGGVGFEEFGADLIRRHQYAFPTQIVNKSESQKAISLTDLPNPGDYYWRNGRSVSN